MIKVDQDIFKELAKKYNLNPMQVRAICTHPFLFAKRVMKDPDDHKDILFHKLFRIKLKKVFANDKNKPYVKTKVAHINKIKNESKNKEIK